MGTPQERRVFYRVLEGDTATERDFWSKAALGEPLYPPHTPARLRLHNEVSVHDSLVVRGKEGRLCMAGDLREEKSANLIDGFDSEVEALAYVQPCRLALRAWMRFM